MTTHAVGEQMEQFHGQLRESVQRFLKRDCPREVVASLEKDPHGYSPDHWRTMADLGWLGLMIPESFGGAGAGLLEMAIVVEALGSAALPSPLFPTVVEAGILIELGGNDDQRQQWLPAIASGEVVLAVALQEPGGDLSPESVRARASPSGNGYRLSGTKLFVPYVEAASHVICVARTGDEPESIGLFFVPRTGLEGRLTRLRTSNNDPQYAVEFTDLEIPLSAALGEPTGAWSHVAAMLERAAALKCAEMVGIGQRALDLTLAFVSERVQFDQPVGKFQAVQHHCVDMYRDLEQTRILTGQAIWRLAGGRQATREVSLAKIKASEGILALLRMAHQLHGGVGYEGEYPLEALYRRSMAAQAAYGAANWHREKLGQMLRVSPDSFRREGAHRLMQG